MNSTERLACFSFRSERTRVETKDFPDRILTDKFLQFLHHRVVAAVVAASAAVVAASVAVVAASVAVVAASVAVVAASVVVVAVAAVEAAGDRIIHDVVTT
jgi:hypothetical protein